MKKSFCKLISLTLCLVLMSALCVSAASYVTLYTEDGRSKSFPESQVAAQLTVGWYREPVQRLYAEGKSKVFPKSQVAAQLNVGWYKEPVQRLYAPGKSKLFPKSQVAAQLTVGWSTQPTVTMYALDGRYKAVAQNMVAANQKVGWYLYADYVCAKADQLKKSSYDSAATFLQKEMLKDGVTEANFYKFYEKLMAICASWYGANDWKPIYIGKYSITNTDGKPYISIPMRNLTQKTIKSFEIEFYCYDKNGKITTDYPYLYNGGVKDTIYVNIIPGDSYVLSGSLPDNKKTTSIRNIKIKKVTYSDGTTWSR